MGRFRHKNGNKSVVNPVLVGRAKTRSYVSPITRRILAINILALLLLVAGLLYVGQYRKGLIDNEIAALNIQAELFAAALGEAAVGSKDSDQVLVVEGANQILRRMVLTTGTIAQIFKPNGDLLIDSRSYRGPTGNVEVTDLPPPKLKSILKDKLYNFFRNALRILLPNIKMVSDEKTAKNLAFKGEHGIVIKTFSNGKLSLSVAVPVQRYKKVLKPIVNKAFDAIVSQMKSLLIYGNLSFSLKHLTFSLTLNLLSFTNS